MPTYSYRCSDCSHEYEEFQSMSADPHTECPECKGKVERLIGAGSGILFKGSGFYVTDYKKTGNGTSSSSDSSGKSSGGESSSGNSSGTSSTSSSGSGSAGSSSGGSGSGKPASGNS